MKPITPTCRLCGQPRAPKITMPLCVEHAREYERAKAERYRRARGIPTLSEVVAARKANAAPNPALHESRRIERLKREVAEGRRICITPECGGKIETIYGRLCGPCLFLKRESQPRDIVERHRAARPKPERKPRKTKPVVLVPTRQVVIGPEAFRKPEPVGVWRGRFRVVRG